MVVEDRWMNLYCLVVYGDDSSEWTIQLRNRNNEHPGEPNLKVWILHNGREVAQYSDHYRGYGRYQNSENLLPKDIRARACKTWNELEKGDIGELELKRMREEFIRKHQYMFATA